MTDDTEAVDPYEFAHGQLTYLQIPAGDIARSAAFYETVLGWSVDPPHASFEAPGVFGQWVEDRPPAPEAGPLLWIHVDDIVRALELAGASGGEVVGGPSPDGPTRILATVRDPGGNVIGLVQHSPGAE